jgi:hypothetical protein
MTFRSKYQRLTATDNDEEEKTVMLLSSPTSPRSPEPWERYLAVFYATILLFVLINLSLFAATASKTGHLSFSVAPAVLDARTLPKPDQYVGLVGDHYGNGVLDIISW